ncbi:MAG: phenylalanine--tRNA ligase subunit alpha [Methylophilales bacterium]|jgi:phenylalanyl-tRNA synthetase alpha chain|nr:phenylalanine--tRNA ligase subunit alpha [Pseudomonadota bacterium]NQW34186.1 phenylalanine--tRNA ligase subunit alpha [Methylophilales bacterium]HCK04396.1 phenylalanine--tRNA ligase subunit alpha [Methylophilaceae bacterium]|tara:strand:- start:1882 stop:2868 length:987 start_codon:yes stop_codon:yes gene_type:complete
MENLKELIKAADLEFSQCKSLSDLDHAKAKYLGKSGPLTDAMRGLSSLPSEEKPKVGALINEIKQSIEKLLSDRRKTIQDDELFSQLQNETIDVTLPGKKQSQGSLHPITLSMNRIQNLFHSIGFDLATGPEIEDDFHNFTALNIPEAHPARAMHDTFYIDKTHVLRTHTSPVQVRYMKDNKPPLRIISPGRVYRVDSDATHSPMFHQVEGLWVDKQVSFANLKSVVEDFLQNFFEDESILVRFRPSFFPFTEPSAEIDMSWNDGWLEIGGCGMIHPSVLSQVNIDPEEYQGFAFGLGVERLTMIKYGVNDLRPFFTNDVRFLKKFEN